MITISGGGSSAVTVNEANLTTTPLHVVSVDNGITRIDAQDSLFGDDVTGGTSGRHGWRFSGLRNELNVLGATTPATLEAGANVTITGGVVAKGIPGNSWNASFYSTESFNPAVEDFAVSWLVEAVDGTIREMGGLDNGPTQNNSYSSIEYAIYQVNGTFYSRVYEAGAAIIHDAGSVPLQVGDRLFVQCVKGVVSYGYIRGGIATIVYTSLRPATQPLFFKGAFNRGDASSGASSMGDVQLHNDQVPVGYSVAVAGGAADVISDDDVDSLLTEAGMVIQSGAVYSDIRYARQEGDRFDNGGTPYDIDFTHSYDVVTGQDTGVSS